MSTRLAVVIPAYCPSAGLIDVVRELSAGTAAAIIVVDDGSGSAFASTFAAVEAFPNVRLLRHAVNLGKGAALKTAFNYALCAFPELAGVITADADGQHHPDDIQAVASALLENPEALVLGARAFAGEVPLRSRIGNTATRAIVHALLGRRIADTQTGLRGIPVALLGRLLKIEATGYEFELEMLIAAHHLGIPIVERTIRTIYEPGNPSSHFNPIVDSMKIYFVLLRFGGVSLLSALLDNLVFILTVHRLGSVLASQALGRAFSVAFNYGMVRSSVFYSRQTHKSTLPKYLALTVVSGSLSYGGIRLLSARYGVGVITAKLFVETVLFFVNFAVQRAFIFKPQEAPEAKAEPKPEPEPEPRPRVPAHPFGFVLGAVFLALLGLEAYGFKMADLSSQPIWYPEGLARFERFAGIFAALAAVLIFAAPRFMGVLMAALVVVLTALAVGPVPVLATAFFFLSANALGARLMRRLKAEAVEDQICATLLGAGVYTFLMTFAARLPVNYPAVWGAALAVPVLLDFRGVRARVAAWVSMLRPPRPSLAGSAAFAVLALVLLAHWLVNLKPETGADGLAMHLAVPANIAMNHRLTIEPARFVWAVMPMAADFAYSIVYQLGGEAASRLLVFAMLLAVCGLFYRALRRWISPAGACLLVACFVATPMVQLVTGSLFVENFLAAMILGMVTAIWRLGETGERRYFYLAMALGGTAMTVKFGALAFVVVALPFAFLEARRYGKSIATLAAGAALLVAAAAPPYAVAYAKTRNPLFPFLNDTFPSPLYPAGVDIRDARFRQKLSLATPYRITFNTDKYYEGQNGSVGFAYLVLVPLGALGLAAARRRPAVIAGAVAFGAGLIVLSTEPNVRYLYAAMPLALIPVGATMAWAAAHRRSLYRAMIVFLLASTAVDAYFLPSCSYYHKDFMLRRPFSRAARQEYIDENASIRTVIDYFNRAHAKQSVLLTHDGASAGLDADVYENHWHQVANLVQIRAATDTPSMLALMERWKVRYFIGRKPEPGDVAQPPALAGFLAACTLPEFEAGDFYLARLDRSCNARNLAEPVVVVRQGYYDDFDPAVVLRGAWRHEQPASGPERNTIASSAAPGAEVSLAFSGKTLYYVYATGPDRGVAQVTIDGVAKDPIDMYTPEREWQRKTGYCCFGPGRHLVTVRATDTKNPASTGYAFDFDSFLVLR